ncbi:TPR repeat-containing thioredoxin TTL1-like [Quillaja saponaria]|uniref:TPR repeat-containing thioredoxin TTL1-like n=1 Tax=Quillaja saponaria TaxID=32244 RepID=A0AAD7PAH7_QUISA|nr:TPR repeat-containing thioredoxin TTL1-like [Quillaja saponaria]
MSQTRKSMQETEFDSLTNRLRDSMSYEKNKPDFKELDLDLPSIICSSVNGGGGAAVTVPSSCSSSSSGSGKSNTTQLAKRPDVKTKNHSGELSGFSVTSPNASERLRSAGLSSKPGHRRSVSAGAPLIYAGGNFSNTANNGCGNAANSVSSGSSTLFPSGNYGHGSIVRGGAKLSNTGPIADDNVNGNTQFSGEPMKMKRTSASSDPEEVKRAGNELYKKGNFVEALSLYDRAISISPDNAAYRSNRSAALTALGRLTEAVRECEEAVRLDPGYGRAHQRLASLYLRFAQVENARSHLCLPGQEPDQSELQKLRSLEKHLNRCADARKIGDWKSALRESDGTIATGADSSPQLLACKVEALLKLHQLEDAESILSNISKLKSVPPSCFRTKFFGMLTEAYVPFVRAQVEMALGRFEDAVAAAEKASMIDCSNVEVARILTTVKMVARARSQGSDLFSSGRFGEACSAYGEGLKYDGSNSVLYCNRAVCWSKLGLWEQSVEDCNQALHIQPNYTKALFRRAVSNAKLERWAEVVKDYEILKREFPGDNEVVESLNKARLALKKYRGEVCDTKFGVEVEEVSGLNKFKSVTSSPGISVVYFKASNELCEEISPFINTLCVRYPAIKFFKVDVEENPAIAKAEGIRMVPTFKIYKYGEKVKEMINPSYQSLENSVKNCSGL